MTVANGLVAQRIEHPDRKVWKVGGSNPSESTTLEGIHDAVHAPDCSVSIANIIKTETFNWRK